MSDLHLQVPGGECFSSVTATGVVAPSITRHYDGGIHNARLDVDLVRRKLRGRTGISQTAWPGTASVATGSVSSRALYIPISR